MVKAKLIAIHDRHWIILKTVEDIEAILLLHINPFPFSHPLVAKTMVYTFQTIFYLRLPIRGHSYHVFSLQRSYCIWSAAV